MGRKSHIVARCYQMLQNGRIFNAKWAEKCKCLNKLRIAWDRTECDRINFICKQMLKMTSFAGLMIIKLSKITYLSKVTLHNDTLHAIFTQAITTTDLRSNSTLGQYAMGQKKKKNGLL